MKTPEEHVKGLYGRCAKAPACDCEMYEMCIETLRAETIEAIRAALIEAYDDCAEIAEMSDYEEAGNTIGTLIRSRRRKVLGQ